MLHEVGVIGAMHPVALERDAAGALVKVCEGGKRREGKKEKKRERKTPPKRVSGGDHKGSTSG